MGQITLQNWPNKLFLNFSSFFFLSIYVVQLKLRYSPSGLRNHICIKAQLRAHELHSLSIQNDYQRTISIMDDHSISDKM